MSLITIYEMKLRVFVCACVRTRERERVFRVHREANVDPWDPSTKVISMRE